MLKKNHDNAILQNRFTAYLKRAVHNKRIDYIYKHGLPQKMEVSIEDVDCLPEETRDFISAYSEYDLLQRALRSIRGRERYILLARIVEEKDFSQIAEEVGLSYGAATSVYYRTLKKLRKMLEVEFDEL